MFAFCISHFSLEDLNDMEYRQVKVRGQFLHDRELYMGPRSFIANNSNTSKGGVFSSQNPGSGFLVITPFKLEDRECVLLFYSHFLCVFQSKCGIQL